MSFLVANVTGAPPIWVKGEDWNIFWIIIVNCVDIIVQIKLVLPPTNSTFTDSTHLSTSLSTPLIMALFVT